MCGFVNLILCNAIDSRKFTMKQNDVFALKVKCHLLELIFVQFNEMCLRGL